MQVLCCFVYRAAPVRAFGPDTQAYKSPDIVELERARDPADAAAVTTWFRSPLSADTGRRLRSRRERDVEAAVERALARPLPDASKRHSACVRRDAAEGAPRCSSRAALAPEGHVVRARPQRSPGPKPPA